MAVMMIVMGVLLVVGGPHGHAGSQGVDAPTVQAPQPNQNDAAKSNAAQR